MVNFWEDSDRLEKSQMNVPVQGFLPGMPRRRRVSAKLLPTWDGCGQIPVLTKEPPQCRGWGTQRLLHGLQILPSRGLCAFSLLWALPQSHCDPDSGCRVQASGSLPGSHGSGAAVPLMGHLVRLQGMEGQLGLVLWEPLIPPHPYRPPIYVTREVKTRAT